MTDQQLLDAGERLYKAFLGSNFTFLELAGLAAARERRTSWAELGQNLKLAVFRLVVLSEPDSAATPSSDDSQAAPSVAAPLDTASADAITTDTPPDGNEPATANVVEEVTKPPAVDPADGGDGTIQ